MALYLLYFPQNAKQTSLAFREAKLLYSLLGLLAFSSIKLHTRERERERKNRERNNNEREKLDR